MKQIRANKQTRDTRTPKMRINLLTKKSTPQLQVLKNYLKRNHPESNKMKQRVMELLNDPLVQERVNQESIGQWDEIIKEWVPDALNISELKLFIIICKMLGKTVGWKVMDEIIKTFRNFREKKLDNSKFIEYLEFLLKIIEHKNWNKLEGPAQKIIIRKIGDHTFDYSGSIKPATQAIEHLLDAIGNRNWNELNKDAKEEVTIEYNGYWASGNSFGNAKKYLKAALRILENEIPLNQISELTAPTLIREAIKQYLQNIKNGKMDSLIHIQSIILDLAIISPEQFLSECETIFKGVNEFQFNSLCAELSGENPELVEKTAKKLEPIWSEAA